MVIQCLFFPFSIKVQVEDKESAGCSFRLDVAPQVTIRQLTQMVNIETALHFQTFSYHSRHFS